MSIEMEKRSLLQKYEASLRNDVRVAQSRLDSLHSGMPYFEKIVTVAETHGSIYMSLKASVVPANDHRPRFWFAFNLNSFRDAAGIFTAFDNISIPLDAWKEDDTDDDASKLWSYEDEQLIIYFRAYLTDNSTCQKVQIGEKIVKEYVQVPKLVPVYQYICPEDESASEEQA